MDRQADIVKKVMKKLGMIGEPKDPVDDNRKNNLLKTLWNQREPENIYKIVDGFFKKEALSKEAKQDLLKFFKLKGLIKRTIKFGAEKMWRILLKENDLQGFLLEN